MGVRSVDELVVLCIVNDDSTLGCVQSSYHPVMMLFVHVAVMEWSLLLDCANSVAHGSANIIIYNMYAALLFYLKCTGYIY